MKNRSLLIRGLSVGAITMLLFVSFACTKKLVKTEKIVEEPVPVPPPPVEEDPPARQALPDLPEPTDETDTASSELGDVPLPGDEALKDIHFDYNKYTLTRESREILEANAKYLLTNPTVKVTIEGHCDERGSGEYNLALGEKRALSSKAYLQSLGVPVSQMSSISYGEEMPVDSGHNEAAWAQNRRSHFR